VAVGMCTWSMIYECVQLSDCLLHVYAAFFCVYVCGASNRLCALHFAAPLLLIA
jgi:hypothetical protein